MDCFTHPVFSENPTRKKQKIKGGDMYWAHFWNSAKSVLVTESKFRKFVAESIYLEYIGHSFI